jgi:Zn-dependent protease with chaperone function
LDSSDLSILIGRLERQADERPQLYLVKVAGAAALGYAGVALVAIGVLSACFLIIQSIVSVGKPSLWLVLAGAAGVAALTAMVRSLGLRIAEPDGLQITREEAPQLFALIDDVSGKVNGAPFASVTVNGDFGVSVSMIPGWGLFGAYRSHLQIGVPLLIALSVEEFTSVLAHEMGHFSGRDRPFHAWIYRQRMTWSLLQAKFAEPARTFDRMLAAFHGWYAPWFCAYTFALARNHEYEADRVAAGITSPDSVGRALTKLDLMGRFLAEVFWARFLAQVEKTPEPPYRPYSLLPRAFAVAAKEWASQQWLTESLRRYAAEGDTHPSLAERLAALDVSPRLPAFAAEAAALTLTGPSAARLISHCDDVWRAQNLANWRKRHDELKEARWNIAQYEQHDSSALSPEDLWAKAHLLFTVNREAAGIETLQLLVARPGTYPDAHLLLGRLLLAHSDEHGLPHLITAAEQNFELASTAGSIGYTYLVNRGRKGEAMRFWQRISALIGD